jgi:hypothetical protein
MVHFGTEVYLKKHAPRFMLIFVKIMKASLKVNYCKVNKESKLHVQFT